MTLQTLTRGDGLLGMRPSGRLGPRGGEVTVVFIDWMYVAGNGMRWEIPAPTTLLNRRPASTMFLNDVDGQAVYLRDLDAEADALDRVWDLGLQPLPAENLQWRAEDLCELPGTLWTLTQEDQFDDFWADELPSLQSEGWSVVVRPGFTHESVTVDAWHVIVSHATGEVLGKEAVRMRRSEHAVKLALSPLDQTSRGGSWMLSLGMEIHGQVVDLVPLLAQLIRRDGRWLHAEQLARIDDKEMVRLRAPGGKRIDAPAGALKPIVGHFLDLLSDQHRQEGPLPLSSWDAQRVDALFIDLEESARERAGAHGTWQLQGDAGLRSLARRLFDAGAPTPVAPPVGLEIVLRPYQLHGLAWLQYLREHRLAGILADDMGLGKTAQTLAHVLLEKQAGRLDLPALVVLPTSLIFNWQAEAGRIAPSLRVLTLQGPQRAEDFARMAEVDLVLTTYPLLWRDIDSLRTQRYHFLILDEAQTVKNAGSRGAQAVRRLQARHRLSLTGTPLENNLGELWTQFDFLMPGFLGDARSFTRLWRRPIEVNGETLRAQLLARRVRPFILRRRKDEVASELPPRTDMIRRVQLQGRQRDLYESVRVAADDQVRRILKRKGFAGAQITILDALLKLRQVCCDPYLLKEITPAPDIERAKLELLQDMLPALVAEGRRILVFSQFREMLSILQGALTDLNLPWLALTGETRAADRGAIVAQFQARTVPILLVTLKAGGVGLNLTAADTVIHMEPWWNPAVEEQATARAHRIGQDQSVFVIKLVVEGSIEERILELQARKAALADSILGNDQALAPKFSQEDLDNLLAPLR
ncbi:DEAD/DEAH box helicase [Noviherbaspirillum galbum]|nr:DEAD/DEAH box helicase [Noviherbaspirillum galbum]